MSMLPQRTGNKAHSISSGTSNDGTQLHRAPYMGDMGLRHGILLDNNDHRYCTYARKPAGMKHVLPEESCRPPEGCILSKVVYRHEHNEGLHHRLLDIRNWGALLGCDMRLRHDAHIQALFSRPCPCIEPLRDSALASTEVWFENDHKGARYPVLLAQQSSVVHKHRHICSDMGGRKL